MTPTLKRNSSSGDEAPAADADTTRETKRVCDATAHATSAPMPSSSSSQYQHELRERISLTPQEQELFEFLLDVERQYGCACVLRVAGGWVRDKLLGRHSDDVDIVLDVMKGKQFADLINTYERDHGHKQHPVGVIKANPEQSKHLETATMQLGAIGWVDFVNLRAETYSEDHRIPDVEFGTPLQDAERRDFTINSLFYNISEQKVEDFTGRGVEDLRNGILRTPLDPRVTFLDDPLRVLRAVRFASRFDLQLDDSLRAAVELDEVKEALVKKVSRERVGKELVGMLVGSAAHPERALRLIHELRLCKPIFLPPTDQPIFKSDGTPEACDATSNEEQNKVWDLGYAYAASMYDLVLSQKSAPSDDASKPPSEDKQNALKLRILASFLLPFADHYVVEKKRQVLLPTFVIRESLKLRNRDAEDVGNVILKNVAALRALTHAATFNRVEVGLLLREIKSLWELCRDVALVQELVASESSEEQRQSVTQLYQAFSDQVTAHGLDGIWDLKPLLNGNELVKELQVKPGPSIKLMLDKILIWQLEHPEKTRDDCLAHFKTLSE